MLSEAMHCVHGARTIGGDVHIEDARFHAAAPWIVISMYCVSAGDKQYGAEHILRSLLDRCRLTEQNLLPAAQHRQSSLQLAVLCCSFLWHHYMFLLRASVCCCHSHPAHGWYVPRALQAPTCLAATPSWARC